MTLVSLVLPLAVDPKNVNPGVLGFVVVALLGVATWLLIRSMHRQLGKIDFDEGADAEQRDADHPDRQG